VSSPFRFLEERGIIEETVPVFGAKSGGGAKAAAESATTTALLHSLSGPEEELRGINVLRVTRERDVEAVIRALQDTPGVAFVERAPARWATTTAKRRASAPGGASATATATATTAAQKLWNLHAIHWVR